MEDLKQLREKIDQIDEKLVELFEERMETVLKVAAYKKENNIPILNQSREDEVIEKNKNRLKNKDFESSLEKLFICLMYLSKEEQKKTIDNTTLK